MKVVQLGEGTPEIAVLAGVHGDEPCGVRAVERLAEENPSVRRPVKLVVANEQAIAAGKRYVEEDLNRVFPGDPEADTHERRLARRVSDEVADCFTLSLHSTKSHAEPFAVINGVSDEAREICPRLPIAAVVETGNFVEGRLFNSVRRVIEIECGYQGSDQAAENADRITRAFLTAVGALPGDTQAHDVPLFRLTDRIQKGPASSYSVFAENFERVDAGERFAAADDTDHVADEAFYPVLLSANGYSDVFGYTAELIGELSGTPTVE